MENNPTPPESLAARHARIAEAIKAGKIPNINRTEFEYPPARWNPELMCGNELAFKTRAMVAFLADATGDYSDPAGKRLVYPYHRGLSECLGVVVDALDILESWFDPELEE